MNSKGWQVTRVSTSATVGSRTCTASGCTIQMSKYRDEYKTIFGEGVTLIEIANAFHARNKAEVFGIRGDEHLSIDIPAAMRRRTSTSASNFVASYALWNGCPTWRSPSR